MELINDCGISGIGKLGKLDAYHDLKNELLGKVHVSEGHDNGLR